MKMPNTKQRTRLAVLLVGFFILGFVVWFILTNLESNIVYFRTPSELKGQVELQSKVLRVGGLVKENSVAQMGLKVRFEITDTKESVEVRYEGGLPDLFREGQGVVAEGSFKDGIFFAKRVIAKHDETYMPKEAQEALKRAGVWRGGEGGSKYESAQDSKGKSAQGGTTQNGGKNLQKYRENGAGGKMQ